MKKTCVFDIECDGFNPTKIHCLTASVFSQGEWRSKSTTNYKEMRKFFENSDVLVGHNIIRFDIPVVEKILGIKVSAELVDTLALSWYLYPEGINYSKKHGLEDWGEYFGIPKPKIEDWDNLPVEEYIRRCEEDVKINCKLYDKELKDLHIIYEDEEGGKRLIDYLMFKMDCAREAERSRWKLDVDRCKEAFDELTSEKDQKVEELAEAMPEVDNIKVVKKPDSMYLKGRTYKKPKVYIKSDGDFSAAGKRFNKACKSVGENPEEVDEVYLPSKELSSRAVTWLEAVTAAGLDETYDSDIEVVSSVDKGNPNSHDQVKKWLFDLGWKPENYNDSVKTDEDGREYVDKIPQVRVDGKDGKELCPSVKKLFKVEPRLEVMEGLTVLTHRLGILKGYLRNVDEEGYLKAEISGFTNTLRFKHSVIVNLPSIDKPYGEIVRGVLIAPEGYELCGSDMSALENRTRDHYIQPYDPEYVETMKDKNYDPHLAIAVQAGFITQDESDFYKWYKK